MKNEIIKVNEISEVEQIRQVLKGERIEFHKSIASDVFYVQAKGEDLVILDQATDFICVDDWMVKMGVFINPSSPRMAAKYCFLVTNDIDLALSMIRETFSHELPTNDFPYAYQCGGVWTVIEGFDVLLKEFETGRLESRLDKKSYRKLVYSMWWELDRINPKHPAIAELRKVISPPVPKREYVAPF